MVSQTQIVEDYADVMHNYDPTKNTTRNVLTRYEKAKLIGMRMEQLARGFPPCVDDTSMSSVRDIAIKELETRTMPFMIARTLPNGKKEYWKLDDMIV